MQVGLVRGRAGQVVEDRSEDPGRETRMSSARILEHCRAELDLVHLGRAPDQVSTKLGLESLPAVLASHEGHDALPGRLAKDLFDGDVSFCPGGLKLLEARAVHREASTPR